jgi:uncharacterized membrane protein YbaN (DUF454 family)
MESSMGDDPSGPPARTGLARWCLLILGLLSVLLGIVGAFLPIIPTTPFLLLAAACFMRSSPALHQRLLTNRIFGPYLVEWQRDHTVPLAAKRKAYGMVIVSFSVSAFLVPETWMRLVVAGIGLAMLALLFWLPTSRNQDVV